MKHFAVFYEIKDEESEKFENDIKSDEKVRMYYSDDDVDKKGFSYLWSSFKNNI